MNITLTTVATIPASTGITITVYEDLNLDGVAEYSAAQVIATGSNVYTLTGFTGGGRYSYKAEFTSSDPLAAAVLDDEPVIAEASGVSGTLAVTTADDTLAAAGTTTVAGTLAVTTAADTLAASGAVGNDVSGTLAATLASDTLAASGTTTVVGTLAATTGADTLAASGTTTVTGSLAVTTGNDTLVASDAAAGETPALTGGGGWYGPPSYLKHEKRRTKKRAPQAPPTAQPPATVLPPVLPWAPLAGPLSALEAEIGALLQAQLDEEDAIALLLAA